MSSSSSTLPIEEALPELLEALSNSTSAVLVAPPGAGKTTRVPLAVLNEPWLEGRRILMLEPRRLAARSAARYMAELLGEQIGETVGYRVKHDTKVGAKTRIEVITEGVLTRILQADPALEQAGIVIFDEFHERSLHADLGLALCMQSQSLLREDLRILVMSATLQAEPVAELLDHCPIVRSAGRSFPVETVYLNKPYTGRIETLTAQTTVQALTHQEGDVIVFLPGTAEIRRTEARLRELQLGSHIHIVPLHGSLTQEQQDIAIAPSLPDKRKIVLATSIAETSLTVEGVRIVIDSGLMRVPRFSPRTGMTRLDTVAVSQASADQRRGRAGRLGPGICYRLWTEQENRRLTQRSTPEIWEADLAPLALELAAWGITDPGELAWLDTPPAPAYSQARELLSQLGALNESGAITPHGKKMAELAVHPRLAQMLLKGAALGTGGLACELAAVLSERDFLRSQLDAPNADLRLRIEALRSGAGQSIDLNTVRRIRFEANLLKQLLGIHAETVDDSHQCGLLLAYAYPDRIAQRRGTGRFLLRNGRGAVFTELQPLSNASYLVAAELDDQGAESRIYLAAPLAASEFDNHLQDQIVEEITVKWDPAVQAVRANKRQRIGALVLKEVPISAPKPEDCVSALLQGIREEGLEILPWTRGVRQLQQRLAFMHKMHANWPDVSEEMLLSSMEDWLAPHLYGMKSRQDLQKMNLANILEAGLSWEQRRGLDEQAPTHIQVPSGSRIPVDYSDPASPVLSVRLQEMFGLSDTPRIAGGAMPLTLHLLSPAQRPVQVTRDLASFWRETYFEVKKDLKGRYPKHYWPEDPHAAVPTNRVRPKI